MYQFKWLTVSGSSASGLVSLPAKTSAFFWSQAALRALILVLPAGLAATRGNALVQRDLVLARASTA